MTDSRPDTFRAALLQGAFAGPALGALVGLADCVRALVEGGSVLTPDFWLEAVALYALAWLPLGILAGLVGGLFFSQKVRATTLLAVLGTVAAAYGAYENIVNLPAFTAPESLRFDAILLGGSVAVFFVLYLFRVPIPLPRPRRFFAALLVPLGIALAAPLFTSSDEGPVPEVKLAEGARPNVVIVLADTLRADHLGTYGYERPTSPNLDALAADSTVFLNCRVASTWTKPSTASILTGLLPTAHGAVEPREVLPGAATTLAEVFRAGGYRTAAWSDNPFVSREFGFAQGFEEFDGISPSPFVNGTLLGTVLWTLKAVNMSGEPGGGDRLPEDRGSTDLVGRFLSWAGDGGEPFFAYLHVMEPHVPYDPPAPFRDRFADPHRLGPDLAEPPWYGGFLPFTPGPPLAPDQRDHLVARYDEEILAFDAALGELVAGLAGRGLLERTVIVVVSDHGEEFYEHEGWTHGHSLYDELLRVPLVIRAPGVKPTRIGVPVRATDLFPTLLGLAGIGAEGTAFGIDLSGAIRGGGTVPSLPAVAEVDFGAASARAVVSEGRKLITAHSGDDRREQLFDLVLDPGERDPLEKADWAAKLRARLEEALSLAESLALTAGSRELSPEEEQRLRGLGYLR